MIRTRQGNFETQWVEADLAAFYDDVVLAPECCSEMQRTHRALGKQVVGVEAAVENDERADRQDDFRTGYRASYNRYEIHRRSLPNRARRDVACFIYSWTFDTVMLIRHAVYRRRSRFVLR